MDIPSFHYFFLVGSHILGWEFLISTRFKTLFFLFSSFKEGSMEGNQV